MTRRRTIPTVAQYAERVEEGVGATRPGAALTYQRYWQRLVQDVGDKRLDEVTELDIKIGAERARKGAVHRANGRDGRSASEHYIAAARQFFATAIDERLVSDNPASGVRKPQRRPSRRRALNPQELEDLWRVAARGGNDPALDVLLLRFHLETGARREGALNLKVEDMRVHDLTIELHEKFNMERQQPVSLTLWSALEAHMSERGVHQLGPGAAVFRYTNGAPLTRRRYNTLFERVQRTLPWAAAEGVSVHWLRHTAVTMVERVAGYAVAQAFAGHTGREVTGTYIRASVQEVARAVSTLTGEPHPLAA